MTTGTGIGRRQRLVRRAVVAAFVGSCLLCLVLWLAFQHKPAWYRPASLDATQSQAAKADAVAAADYVSDRMVEGRLFEIRLTDRSVNSWLAALPYAWPEASEILPPELTDAAIRFDPGRVRVGAHCRMNGWQAILSLSLRLSVSKDGGDVIVALTGVQMGSLPVPRPALRRLFEHLRPSKLVRQSGSTRRTSPVMESLAEVQSIDELFAGVHLENRFVWFNGERPFRVRSFEIDEGRWQLRIEPL